MREISAPTLILVGRHDPEAPLACSEEIAGGLPGAELVIFEDSGHYPFIEESDRFDALIGTFLGQL